MLGIHNILGAVRVGTDTFRPHECSRHFSEVHGRLSRQVEGWYLCTLPWWRVSLQQGFRTAPGGLEESATATEAVWNQAKAKEMRGFQAGSLLCGPHHFGTWVQHEPQGNRGSASTQVGNAQHCSRGEEANGFPWLLQIVHCWLCQNSQTLIWDVDKTQYVQNERLRK